jgi:hypothetical protein
MRYITIIIVVVLLIGGGIIIATRDFSSFNGGNNNATTTPNNNNENPSSVGTCAFQIASIKPNDEVSFPLTITGKIDNSGAQSTGCSWQVFEAQAGVAKLFYYSDLVWKPIGSPAIINVPGDWMATTSTFTTTLNFNNTVGLKSGDKMKIRFESENASGLPQFDKSYELPVTLKINDVSKMKVKFALLAPGISGSSNQKGCDAVTFKEVEVPKTQAVLDASLRALFADNTPWPPTSEKASGNFVGAQNLAFSKVTLSGDLARVYLTGSVSLAGVCDDPRLSIQVSETANQFPTVHGVEIYINNKIWTIPSQR